MDEQGNLLMSLYEYQQRPDREKIGQKVYRYAKYKKVKIGRRELGPRYGNISVMTYPRDFLIEYFKIRKAYQELTKFM